ncbi:hypothetical protein C9374_011676 [Naegleria lovaniensis]|uniref:Ubiquitin-like domain-containing protein n=1 Tax=Naegleria lovaniensis TaxID=51637 RepID=A0AA88GH49_NAELO|nr:uncharacterized protein C9374_011676 [Naegleria lovaniensis]KAG2374011.1 hypothetical protein C9374_011676 [Naegleria lovaniensis]
MRCRGCGKNKLSKEFFSIPLSNSEQICTLCLACAAESKHLPNEDREFARHSLQDNVLLETPSSNMASSTSTSFDHSSSSSITHVIISTLEGEKYQVPIHSLASTTVQVLKLEIQKITNIHHTKQCLMFNSEELNKDRLLGSYPNLISGSTVFLMVLLYHIADSSDIKEIEFNLVWGFSGSADYLDGTCIFFSSDRKYVDCLDFRSTTCLNGSFRHSGDVMTSSSGNHVIKAKLSEVPSNVQYVFFVLSSYNSPTIEHFLSPGFKFFDVNHPETMLSEYNIQKAAKSQAVLVSVLYRTGTGWNIAGLGILSAGNAKNYQPIKETVSQVLSKGNL